MSGMILALFGAALATGVAELLLPSEDKNSTVRLFRFLVSLVILLLILTPFLGFLENSENIFKGELSFEEGELADYEQIFEDAVQTQSEADLREGLYDFLDKEYGISKQNATLLIGFDADGALSFVKIYLKGSALTQNPDALSKALRKKLGCTVEVW